MLATDVMTAEIDGSCNELMGEMDFSRKLMLNWLC